MYMWSTYLKSRCVSSSPTRKQEACSWLLVVAGSSEKHLPLHDIHHWCPVLFNILILAHSPIEKFFKICRLIARHNSLFSHSADSARISRFRTKVLSKSKIREIFNSQLA